MTVLSGKDGQLIIDGQQVLRCRGWSMATTRRMRRKTPVGTIASVFRPGRRSSTGNTSIQVSNDDGAGRALLNRILSATGEISAQLVLNRSGGARLVFDALVTTTATTVGVGAATAARVSFTATGPVQEVS